MTETPDSRAQRQQRYLDQLDNGDTSDVGGNQNDQYIQEELTRICSDLGLGDEVQEKASDIYHTASSLESTKRRSIDSMILASVYIASRQERVARTLEEISGTSSVSKSKIGRTYRFLMQEVDGLEVQIIQPSDFFERFIRKLNGELKSQGKEQLDEETIERIEGYIKQAEEDGMHSSKSPNGVAAGAIYQGARDSGRTDVRQRDVAKISDIAESTVRKRKKDFE